MTATLARDCSDGFAPEDFRHTAVLLLSTDDAIIKATLSNNLNIIIAALDQAGSHDALVSALQDCAESLALARDKLGMVGEGDDKDRKADAADTIGSHPALVAARAALDLAGSK